MGYRPGVCMPVDPAAPDGECIAPFHLGDLNVTLDDPDHSNTTSVLQYDGAKMDGFVYALDQKNQDGRLAMMYYDGGQMYPTTGTSRTSTCCSTAGSARSPAPASRTTCTG